MSDEIAQVVEQDVAQPMLKAIEDIGETVPSHFEGIGERLEGAATAHLENESGIVSKIEGISPGAVESETAGAAESGAADMGGEPVVSAQSGQGAPVEPPTMGGDASATGQASGGNGSCTTGGDPVDVVSGQMIDSVTDLTLRGLLPLVLRRAYASGYQAGRRFGPGWSSTLDQRVEVDEDGIHFAGDDAQILHYPVPSQPGQLVFPADGARWPLAWDRATDTVTIEDPERGWTRHFSPAGPGASGPRPISALTDRNGNRIDYLRDGDGILIEVRHSGGYRVVVDTAYTAAGFRVEALRLLGAEGSGTEIVRYGYDPRGRLTQVVDSSGAPYIYEYDDADRMTAWIDRNGHRYEYEYDDVGRVVRGHGPEGNLSAQFDYQPGERLTTVTDSLGHSTRYRYDEHDHVCEVVDPLGHTTITERDRYGRLIAETDALGHVTRYTLDDRGNPVRVARPDGTSVEAAYDHRGLPTRVVGPDEALWRYTYDERGNLLTVVDPQGATTSYLYDERGFLSSVTDPLGHERRYAYNAAGLPVEVVDMLGGSSTVEYDDFGRPVAVTDPGGTTTRAGWTVDGRPAWRLFPDGHREEWSYDPQGNQVRHTDAAGNTTLLEYGPFDRVTARVGPDGARLRFAYDKQLRIAAVTNPQGLEWRYDYDAAGNLVSEQDFNGRTLTYRHDAAGRIVERVNGAGQRTAFRRDAAGRVVECRTEDGATTTLRYGADCRLARAESADCVLEYTRDAMGRILTETVDGRTSIYEYDVLGRRTARTTPSGAVSRWEYSAAGRPTALVGTAGSLSFEYDDAGRETTRYLGPLAALTQSWDVNSRLTGQAIWRLTPSAQPEAAQPDPAQAVEYHQLQARTYSYRPDGCPVEIADHLRGTRRFDLNPRGRVTAVHASDWTETYAYDAAGNLAHSTDSGETHDAAGDREFTGTLIRRAGRTHFDYDGQGRLVRARRRTLSGTSREWIYRWDAQDRLVEASTPDAGRWQYLYDPLGRRIAKRRIDEDGGVAEELRFAWEGTRLAEQTDIDATGRIRATTWDWEPGSYRAATQTYRSWAADADQDEIDQRFYAIVTDLVGTPQELVTPDGAIAWRSSQRLWGAPITESDTGAGSDTGTDCPLRFPGQYHDPETGLHYNYFRYYDPRVGRYLSADPLGLAAGSDNYAYAGNPTARYDPLGLSCTVAAGAADPNVDTSRIMPQPYVERTDTNPVFRTDNRSPDEIFRDGFQPKDINGNADLQEHVDNAPDGMFVSATRDPEGVGGYPYTYEIHAPGGVDLNATADQYGNLSPNRNEQEIAFPGGIDSRFIKSAQQYDEDGNPIGDPIPNPNFGP